jgi:hypothetical protein
MPEVHSRYSVFTAYSFLLCSCRFPKNTPRREAAGKNRGGGILARVFASCRGHAPCRPFTRKTISHNQATGKAIGKRSKAIGNHKDTAKQNPTTALLYNKRISSNNALFPYSIRDPQPQL